MHHKAAGFLGQAAATSGVLIQFHEEAIDQNDPVQGGYWLRATDASRYDHCWKRRRVPGIDPEIDPEMHWKHDRQLRGCGSFATPMANILIELKHNHSHVRELQIAEANKHCQPNTFVEGLKVFISTQNIPLTYTNSAEIGHHKTLQQKYREQFKLVK
jgi:hypothetical protein